MEKTHPLQSSFFGTTFLGGGCCVIWELIPLEGLGDVGYMPCEADEGTVNTTLASLGSEGNEVCVEPGDTRGE